MTVKAVLPVAILLFASMGCQLGPAPASAEGGIQWHGYEDGMDLSLSQNKSVLIDFSTSWCSWCKKMDQDTYNDTRVIEKALRFVCIRVDGDARGDLVARYSVDGYPTTVFLGPGGAQVHKVVGYKGPDDLLKDMSYALGEGAKPAPGPGSCLPWLIPLFAVPAVFYSARRRNAQ